MKTASISLYALLNTTKLTIFHIAATAFFFKLNTTHPWVILTRSGWIFWHKLYLHRRRKQHDYVSCHWVRKRFHIVLQSFWFIKWSIFTTTHPIQILKKNIANLSPLVVWFCHLLCLFYHQIVHSFVTRYIWWIWANVNVLACFPSISVTCAPRLCMI